MGNDWRIAAGDLKHFVGHIHANDSAFWPNDLPSNETNLSRAAAKIENRFAFAQMTRRITAAVIALDYFLGDDFKIIGAVFDRTAKFVRAFLCSRRVTLADDGFFPS